MHSIELSLWIGRKTVEIPVIWIQVRQSAKNAKSKLIELIIVRVKEMMLNQVTLQSDAFLIITYIVLHRITPYLANVSHISSPQPRKSLLDERVLLNVNFKKKS